LGTEIVETTVDAITPDALFREHGMPYYLKIDIEGRDMLVVNAIAQFAVRPPYLSVETEAASFEKVRAEFAALRRLGYNSFKLSAQHNVHRQQIPPRSPHGRVIEWVFQEGSSGPFGEDLGGAWMSEPDALAAYKPIQVIYDVERAVRSGLLQGSFNEFLARFGYESGWYDTHARHESYAYAVVRGFPRSSAIPPFAIRLLRRFRSLRGHPQKE
jgi:hypothetical protein